MCKFLVLQTHWCCTMGWNGHSLSRHGWERLNPYLASRFSSTILSSFYKASIPVCSHYPVVQSGTIYISVNITFSIKCALNGGYAADTMSVCTIYNKNAKRPRYLGLFWFLRTYTRYWLNDKYHVSMYFRGKVSLVYLTSYNFQHPICHNIWERSKSRVTYDQFYQFNENEGVWGILHDHLHTINKLMIEGNTSSDTHYSKSGIIIKLLTEELDSGHH